MSLGQAQQIDEYRLIRLLGSGAMGTVYLAHDTLLDRAVAIKVISSAYASAEQRTRFLTEARALARLHHVNIVGIYRIGEYEGRPYLVSEYVRGQPLSSVMKPVPSEQLRGIAGGLCRGLEAAHRAGVLHRDIKPANTMLTEDGESKLLDFGLAKLAESMAWSEQPMSTERVSAPIPIAPGVADGNATVSLAPPSLMHAEGGSLHALPAVAGVLATQAGARMGTPLYMPPEIWRGEVATVRSDLYSLGALLYELACGQPPYWASQLDELARLVQTGHLVPLRDKVPGIDERLASAIDRCLQHEPGERPASATALLAAITLSPTPRWSAPAETVNPYRGLLPFEAEHRAFFLGRSAELQDVVELLRQGPVALVTGASGTGKSSLCRAGVLPRMEEGAMADGRKWQAIRMTPGKRPLLTLVTLLAPLWGQPIDEILALAARDSAALIRLLLKQLSLAHDAPAKSGKGVLLFIDQLEELVVQSDPTEAATFSAVLAELVNPLPSVRILGTVRGDFLLRVMELSGLRRQLAQGLYVLPPLRSEALHEIIAAPARMCGFEFADPAQVGEMAAGISTTDGGLPLLQFALAELWLQRDIQTKTIPATALTRIGGTIGALARHADGVLSQLSSSEYHVAAHLLMRMVTASGTRIARTLNELSVGTPESAATVSAVLETLVRARLVMVRQTQGEGSVYDIAHEALIHGWSTLRDWISKDAERRAVHERLEHAAAEWHRLSHSPDALLRSQQLAEVEAGRILPADLSPDTSRFLLLSQRAARTKRWLQYSAPFLVFALLLAGQRAVRWYSARDARDKLAQAQTTLQAAQKSRQAAAAKQGQAYAAFDRPDPKSQDEGQNAWLAALDERQKAAQQYQDALLLSGGAALSLYGEESAKAHDLVLQAAKQRDRLDLAFAQGFPADNDQPDHASLDLKVLPAGTQVTLQQADGNATPRGWRKGEVIDTTLLAREKLPIGSYLLTFTAPGRVAIRYPVLLLPGETRRVQFELPTPAMVPNGYIFVPPGRFLYGSGDSELLRDWFNAQPIHVVDNSGFIISAHEITYQDWIAFLEALPAEERYEYLPREEDGSSRRDILSRDPSGGYSIHLKAFSTLYTVDQRTPIRYKQRRNRVQQNWLHFPVSGISLAEANRYFHWLNESGLVPGARLCTSHEWERAARGADERRFPSGDKLLPDDANIDVTYARQDAAFGPDEVGSHPASNSPFGVADLAGNVWELVRASALDTKVIIRGGAFFHGQLAAASVNQAVTNVNQRNVRIGLRVCAPISTVRNTTDLMN